jgi:hypothetical protein
MKRLIAVPVAAMALLIVFAASAQACSSVGAARVFTPWGDQLAYVLAPDGGYEAGGSGWALSGGAGVTAGNESSYLHGLSDKRSLSLPSGSTATSPPVCMAIDTPVFRMMARNTGDPTSQLRVTASYLLLGLVRTKTVGIVTAGAGWAPTTPQSTVLTLSTVIGTLLPSAIQIHLEPTDSKGRWQVDDLYVDPFSRR